MATESKCPFSGAAINPAVSGAAQTNFAWWPNQLKLNVLDQHSAKPDPMGETFSDAEEFKRLDFNTVVRTPSCARCTRSAEAPMRRRRISTNSLQHGAR